MSFFLEIQYLREVTKRRLSDTYNKIISLNKLEFISHTDEFIFLILFILF